MRIVHYCTAIMTVEGDSNAAVSILTVSNDGKKEVTIKIKIEAIIVKLTSSFISQG